MPEFNPDKHYHGKPCSHGHGTMRYRTSSKCVYCRMELERVSNEKNPERKRRESNAAQKRWAKRHPEQRRKINREGSRRWRQANPGVCAERVQAYEINKRQARPPWYEHEPCRKLYEKARDLGGEVDHVVPLKSEIVCGLHCWHNLQILPGDVNRSKNNRHWPDQP